MEFVCVGFNGVSTDWFSTIITNNFKAAVRSSGEHGAVDLGNVYYDG